MEISIHIPSNAHKQKDILRKIPSPICIINSNTATINCVYDEQRRIKDVFRYTINISQNKPTTKLSVTGSISKFQDRLSTDSNGRKIVLVIESPHKDEYDENFTPIAPAQGATGKNIDTFICNVIDQHNKLSLSEGQYDLIICNPVQFQTSLFHLHNIPLNKNSPAKKIRDKMWRGIYDHEQKNFYSRLCLYSPSVIINACTSELKACVETEILNWLKNTKSVSMLYTADKHPCIWTTDINLEQII
jgi:hypothetical protein